MPKIATFYDHIVDVSRQESCSVVDALKLARELGVEAVEASTNNLVGREDEMGQELAMADLSISSVPSYFDFGRDFDVERKALPIVEAAQYLGADRLLVIPGFWEEGASPQERPIGGDGGRCQPAGRLGRGLWPLSGDGGIRQRGRPLFLGGGGAVFPGPLPGACLRLRYGELPFCRGGPFRGL